MRFKKPGLGSLIACFIFFLIGVLFILILGKSSHETYLKVELLPALESNYLKEIRRGDEVLLRSTINANNKTLVHHFVLGCQQEYYSDDEESGWETVDEFIQPLYVTTPKDLSARLFFEQGCPNGELSQTEINSKNANLKVLGYPKDIALTVLGHVSKLEPLEIEVTNHYGNTRDKYLAHLSFTRNLLLIIGAVMLLIGGLILFLGSWDRNGSTSIS